MGRSVKVAGWLIAIGALLAPLYSSALAEDDPCPAIGRVAESLMKNRQAGVSLQDSLSVMREVLPDNKMARQMVMDAYDVPFFNSAEIKQKRINQFRDEQQLACMKLYSN